MVVILVLVVNVLLVSCRDDEQQVAFVGVTATTVEVEVEVERTTIRQQGRRR